MINNQVYETVFSKKKHCNSKNGENYAENTKNSKGTKLDRKPNNRKKEKYLLKTTAYNRCNDKPKRMLSS